MQMHILIDALSAVMVVVALALVSANLLVIVASAAHRRREAMRFLSHFSRLICLLRLSDSNPSRPYRQR